MAGGGGGVAFCLVTLRRIFFDVLLFWIEALSDPDGFVVLGVGLGMVGLRWRAERRRDSTGTFCFSRISRSTE